MAKPAITPHTVLPQTWADQYQRLERALEAADPSCVAGARYEDALMNVFVHALALRDWLAADRLGPDGKPDRAWDQSLWDRLKAPGKWKMLRRARDLANGAKHRIITQYAHVRGTRKEAEHWVFPGSARPPVTAITYAFADGPSDPDGNPTTETIEGYALACGVVQEWRDLLTGELAVELHLPRGPDGYELPWPAHDGDTGSLARLLLVVQDTLRFVDTDEAQRAGWIRAVQAIERDLVALDQPPDVRTDGTSVC